MTYKEALKWCERFLINVLKCMKPHDKRYTQAIDAMILCIEALENKIPKKPMGITGYWYCPSCGEAVLNLNEHIENEYNHDYCGGCGQKIDWS